MSGESIKHETTPTKYTIHQAITITKQQQSSLSQEQWVWVLSETGERVYFTNTK